MITILSPAKNISTNIANVALSKTEPFFSNEAKHLALQMQQFNPQQLAVIYKASRNISEQNFLHWQQWFTGNSAQFQALWGFNGEVYNGFNVKTLSAEDALFVNDNLRILSGLYGVLKPSDAIQPYRLEMGTTMPMDDLKSLYHYWQSHITNYLSEQIANSSGDKVLLNLASNEYFKVVNAKLLQADVIDVEFKQMINGELKNVTIYVKRARGLMARFVVDNQITCVDYLKAFNSEGYYYSQKGSTINRLLFIR